MHQLLFFVISLRHFVDHDLNTWSEGYVTLLFDMWLLIISHPSVKFNSHKSREKEFITFLTSYMTLWDHVINRLCYVDNRPALEPTTLSCIQRSRGRWNITFLISHVITRSRAQSVKRLDGWWPFIKYLYLFKLGSHRSRGSGDILLFMLRDFMRPRDCRVT